MPMSAVKTRTWVVPVLVLVALTGVFIGTMVSNLFNGARRDIQSDHYNATKAVQCSLENIEDRLIKNIDRLKRNEAALERLESLQDQEALEARLEKRIRERLVPKK